MIQFCNVTIPAHTMRLLKLAKIIHINLNVVNNTITTVSSFQIIAKKCIHVYCCFHEKTIAYIYGTKLLLEIFYLNIFLFIHFTQIG